MPSPTSPSVSLSIDKSSSTRQLATFLEGHSIEKEIVLQVELNGINGRAFFEPGFVSSFFNKHGQNLNPQKLIDVRNQVIAATNNDNAVTPANTTDNAPSLQTQMKMLQVNIEQLPAIRSEILDSVVLPILATLSQAEGDAGTVFTVVHAAATAIKNIWFGGAKDKCIELLENIRLKIVVSPEFFLNPPRRFHPVFQLLHNIIKESRDLVASFIPPDDFDDSLKTNAIYWMDQVTAREEDFEKLNKRLERVGHEISQSIIGAIGQRDFNGNAHLQQGDLTSQADARLDVPAYTKQLAKKVGEWYKSYFTIEVKRNNRSSPIELEQLFVGLKVLHSIEPTSAAPSNVSSGQSADTSSLHKYLWKDSGKANLVLVEGAAGIGKTTFCQKFCCEQNIDGAIVIFVALRQLLDRGRIDSIDDLICLVPAAADLRNALPNILKHKIPIVWVLDGFDEVMRTEDRSLQFFLHNFVDPTTRSAHLKKRTMQDLVRPCDAVILTSRENRADTNVVALDNLKDSSLRPDLWIVQKWKRNNVEDFMRRFFANTHTLIQEAHLQLLVDHSFGPQMSGFHGIPLFVQLLCIAKLDEKQSVWQDFHAKLQKMSAPFLYQSSLRYAFVRAEIRINYVLDANPSFIRYKQDLNVLYDRVLREASQHAFQEFLAHRGTALTFSVPCDESLPIWIQVMREMGVLLNDSSNNTKFRFQHRTFMEYLAAQYVALNPDSISKVPFLNELDTTWLLICQLAVLREDDSFFQKLLSNSFTAKLVSNHIGSVAAEIFDKNRQSSAAAANREQALQLAEANRIKLLVQVAGMLPKNLVLDSLLNRLGCCIVWSAPPQFLLMPEWCGHYGSIHVLKWFDDKWRFKSDVLSRQHCRYALCRALQCQTSNNTQLCIDFLLPRAGDFTVFDAIAADSTVALQMVLNKKNTFEDKELIEILHLVLEKAATDKSFAGCVCLFMEFSQKQIALLNSATTAASSASSSSSSPSLHCYYALALQAALPDTAEIWDFTSKEFKTVNAADEMRRSKRPLAVKSKSDLVRVVGKVASNNTVVPPALVKIDWFARWLEAARIEASTAAAASNSTPPAAAATPVDGASTAHHVEKKPENVGVPPPAAAVAAPFEKKKTDDTELKIKATTTDDEVIAPQQHNSTAAPAQPEKKNVVVKIQVKWNRTDDEVIAMISKLEDPRTVRSLVVLEDGDNLPILTDKAITCIAAKLVNLTSLDLRRCVNITDVALQAIAAKLVHLTSLNLYSCNKVTDAGVQAIATGCVKLTSLNLDSCDKVTDSDLRVIVAKCLKLTSLDLGGCNKITDTGVQAAPTTTAQPEKKKSDDVTSPTVASSVSTEKKATGETSPPASSQSEKKKTGVAELEFTVATTDDEVIEMISALEDPSIVRSCSVKKPSIKFLQASVVTDKAIECIAASLPNLTSLNLSSCDKITDAGLQAIGNLVNLTSLSLCCHNITATRGHCLRPNQKFPEDVKLNVKEGLPKLNIRHCLTNAGVKAVATNLPKLTYLYLYGRDVIATQRN